MEEVPLGVNAVAGVTVNGTEVLIKCLYAPLVDDDEGEGDDQHPLPFVMTGDEVAEGDIFDGTGSGITGSLRSGGA